MTACSDNVLKKFFTGDKEYENNAGTKRRFSMFTRFTRQIVALAADFEDVVGVATLFVVLFVGLTFSGVA